MKVFILLLTLFLFSCQSKVIKKATSTSIISLISIKERSDFNSYKIYSWRKLNNQLTLIGKFNNDTVLDTLKHVLLDLNLHQEIKYVPREWDTLVHWFNMKGHSSNKIMGRGFKTLNLGEGIGLYTLINIGDNNKNELDEIALVIDYFDFSQLNSCNVYEYNENRWKNLFNFEIHEMAFYLPYNENEIRDFLIQKNGKWYYRDYQKSILTGNENDFKPLTY